MSDEEIKRPDSMTRTGSGNDSVEDVKAEFDPRKYDLFLQRVRSEQNLFNGIVAGALAALAGGIIWAAVGAITGLQIGWLAVGIGFLVGYSIRTFGNGLDISFGISGGALSLFGCIAGNIFTIIYFVSEDTGMSFMDVAGQLDMDIIIEMMTDTFSPIDLLFYGLAMYYGYKYSFRKITPEESAALRK